MNYDINDVKELLENLYVIKNRNLQHYERNDDEVDRDYTIAQMDLIVELLQEITGATQEEIYENLGDKIEGVFWFDPQQPIDSQLLQPGTKVCVMRPIDYCSYEDSVCILGKETADEMIEDYLELDDGEVYIPAGTHMTYKGCEDNGWPTFDIHGEEFDFCGDAIKLKLVK